VSTTRLVVNVLAFQAAWLGIVGGAAAGWFWLGPLAALVLVMVHLSIAARPARELAGMALVATVGTSWDVIPAALGLIEYRGGVAALAGAPCWISALWLVFATTLNVSLRWLRARPALAVALGAVGGPLSYQAAAALGALELTAPGAAVAAQAVAWAALLPATSAIAARHDGVTPVVAERAHV
jgi:hypothetical protein